MSLLDKLNRQVISGEIKPKSTMQDWLDTLNEEELEQLEELVSLQDIDPETLQEDDPESEEVTELALLVGALYALEEGRLSAKPDGELVYDDMEEEEFFHVFNSFIFLLPFYYWLKQDLISVNQKISLIANKSNSIQVTLKEFGK